MQQFEYNNSRIFIYRKIINTILINRKNIRVNPKIRKAVV